MAQIEFSLEMRQAAPADGRSGFQFWLEAVSLRKAPHLLPASSEELVFPGDHMAGPATVENCVRICGEAGLRFLTVDLTRAAIGIPAVRVIVPGLRPIRARFADGRLFDVPVKLGWCDTPLAAGKLNPVPLSI